MKTDELINALSADAALRTPSVKEEIYKGLPFAVGVSTMLFAATLGVRPDVSQAISTWRFDAKIVLTVLVALSGLVLVLRLVRPGARTFTPRLMLLGVLCLLGGSVAFELYQTPASMWMNRLIGYNSVWCLGSIPLLSLGPLAAMLWAMRQGACDSPTIGGAVAGLVAGAIGAAIYATHCTDDSPLFVATWYSIGVAVVSGLGAIIGARILRW